MDKVTITWSAFGGTQTTEFEYNTEPTVFFLEDLFRATNLYTGELWDVVSARFAEGRTHHSALSVGDVVTVNGVAHRCEHVGWARVQN